MKNKKYMGRFAMIVLGFITIMLSIPVHLNAATIAVPSQYPTIQDALNASADGDTINVKPSTTGGYLEPITVTKKVALIGF